MRVLVPVWTGYVRSESVPLHWSDIPLGSVFAHNMTSQGRRLFSCARQGSSRSCCANGSTAGRGLFSVGVGAAW